MSEKLRQLTERVHRLREASKDEFKAVLAEMKQLPREDREMLLNGIVESGPQSKEGRIEQVRPPGELGTPNGNLWYAYRELASM
jgi:hypothetical protein